MGARFRVVLVGPSRCAWANEAVADYVRRCRRHGGVEERAVRAERFRGDAARVRELEADRVLGLVGTRDRLVVLDERGDALDTDGFAAMVQKGREAAHLVFAVGGAYGHATQVRDAAWRVVRLSDLVLNHEVARVVLHEQLYRALTVLAGTPYHHR